MATFLTTLSRVDSSNWAICVREGLWGVGTSDHAKRAATNVAVGDEIVVWQAGSGVMALGRATGPARRVRSTAEVPWPDPERYSYLLPITLITALTEPVSDSFDRMVSRRFGIKTHYLQAGLIELDAVGAELRTLFPPRSSTPAGRRRPARKVELDPRGTARSLPPIDGRRARRPRHRRARGAVLADGPWHSFRHHGGARRGDQRRLGEGGTP